MRVMVASMAVLLLAAIASPAASQCVFSNGECFTSSDFLQVLGERFLASVSCFNASPCGSTAEFECVARNVSVDGEASSLCFSTLSPASTTAEVGELLSQCTALETEAACNAQAPPCAWGSGICGPQPSYLLAAVAGSTPEAADEWMRTGSVAQNICRGSTTRAECEGASDEVEEETGVALPEPRRLNRLQATHTHNSFHQTPVDKVLGLFGNPTLITNLPPSAFVNYPDRLEYSHPPLDEQLEEYSVRSLELDLLWDPEGGRYAGRAGVKLSDLLSRTTGQEDQWTETDPAWYAPEEFKVLDVPDSNAGTSCVRLAECLELVAAWSTANPEHLPITIWIEFGKVSSASVLGPSVTTIANNVLADGPPPNALAEPVPFQPEFILEAEAVMVEVLGEDSIVTPTSLKGDSATLSEAVLESQGGQWPTVDEVRGKIMLVLDPSASDALLDLHPGLNGSYFFPSTSVESRADNPEAAFVVYSVPGSSDPDYFEAVGEGAEIADDIVDADVAEVVTLVQEGYLVRAPTDSELIEARGEYTYRRDRMREAGVHYLETDVVAASSVPFNTSYIGGFILSETAGS